MWFHLDLPVPACKMNVIFWYENKPEHCSMAALQPGRSVFQGIGQSACKKNISTVPILSN